ncbi:MAG: carboxylate--amine ligase [Gammaproteobacteria bacterium]|nr:carboxylate--amine ligase [Gammaproteobacteria bacterium]
MQEKRKEHAVVIGLDTMQGLQTARILASHDIPVIGVAANSRHHACRTRVCERIVVTDTSAGTLIGELLALGQSLESKAVLFPCHDHCVSLISRRREELQDLFHIMLADAAVVDMLADKISFYRFVKNLSVKVPQTHILRQPSDALDIAPRLEYPCVIKPVIRTPQWNSQTMSKAFHVADAREFLAVYEKVHGWTTELMVQQWIVGDDSHLYSCNVYFDRDSKPVTSFTARKLRQWPPRVGSSCFGEEVRNDEVRDASLRIFRQAGYVGLGYIEMKQDQRSGVHYAIEANVGRPTGRSAIAEAGGVDMLLAMYCDATGRPMPEGLEQTYAGVKWIDLRHDVQSAVFYIRNGELTVGNWLRSLRGRKAYAVFSWRDPLPFLADLWNAARIAMSREERKRRNHSRAVKSQAAAAALPSVSEEKKL